MNAVTAVAIAFTVVLGFLTMFTIFEHGLGILELIGLLVVALFVFGIFGALGERRR